MRTKTFAVLLTLFATCGCVAVNDYDRFRVRDGGARPDAPGSDGACAPVQLTASASPPTIVFIVDQSASMTELFGDTTGAITRWTALQNQLLTDTGLILPLASEAAFGLALYSGTQTECPMVTFVAPSLNNYDAIFATYSPAVPVMNTPTGESIENILGRARPDPSSSDRMIFVLATDGEPDTCAVPDPQMGQPESVAAVGHAFQLGFRTYVVGVGPDITAQHLSDLANAGVGSPADGAAPYWIANDSIVLRDALNAVVQRELRCVLSLDGEILDSVAACAGATGTVIGSVASCGDPDGWHILDSTHIEALRGACDTLIQTGGFLGGIPIEFPCGTARR